jgi:hypothetical protein
LIFQDIPCILYVCKEHECMGVARILL